jgi:hypothetical protein
MVNMNDELLTSGTGSGCKTRNNWWPRKVMEVVGHFFTSCRSSNGFVTNKPFFFIHRSTDSQIFIVTKGTNLKENNFYLRIWVKHFNNFHERIKVLELQHKKIEKWTKNSRVKFESCWQVIQWNPRVKYSIIFERTTFTFHWVFATPKSCRMNHIKWWRPLYHLTSSIWKYMYSVELGNING